MDRIKRLAYFIWRALPPGNDLDDITSEAILGALQAREGCEMIAAKRAIIGYLRRCNPGSRGTGRQCLNSVWWMPTGEARQERLVLDAEVRGLLVRAVSVLTAKELAVLEACYWDEMPQSEAARIMGTTEAYYSRLKSRAIGKLRKEMEVIHG